jgi:hypothetical protein
MSEADRVQRWRQRQREAGKEPLTLWISRETKLRLEDLAATSRRTPAELVEHALAQFQPGAPSVAVTVPDAEQLRLLMHEALRETTAVTELVTDIVTATLARDLPALVREAMASLGVSPVTDTDSNVPVTEATAPRAAHQRKLTPRQVRALRDKHRRGVPVPALMEEYGISRASVFRYLQSEQRERP